MEPYTVALTSLCITEGKGQIKGVIFDLTTRCTAKKSMSRVAIRLLVIILAVDMRKALGFLKAGKPAIDELLKELCRESEKAEVLKVYRSQISLIFISILAWLR